MAYTLRIKVALEDYESGVSHLDVTREYKIDYLAGISGVMEHASKSIVLASEGVEKFGLTDSEDAA